MCKHNLSLKSPMKRFAKEGANLVFIAVPPTCKKSLLSYLKLLLVNTKCSNLQIYAFVGFS